MTDLNVDGRQCLDFSVSGNWAHFRRIDTTTDKQTYRVIPRTTVAGLVAAVLGEPRNSYYDTFQPDNSAIAIEPTTPLRTMQVPMLTLPTSEGDIQTAEGVSGKTVVDPGKIEESRKRRNFEYLRNPAYRINLVLDDEETYNAFRSALEDGRAVYTPYLGKSECLATLEYHGEQAVSTVSDATAIDSTVPESRLTPAPGVSYQMERTPAYMERDGSYRRTTAFQSYAYTTDESPIDVAGADAAAVDDRTVCFF